MTEDIILANSIRHIIMPDRMARLPLTDKGYPALFFAAVIDGKPNIRVIDAVKFKLCLAEKLCWLCGEPLESEMTFVVSTDHLNIQKALEPPSHRECAEYAMVACPFITNPDMKFHNRAYQDRPKEFHLYTTTSYEVPFVHRWPVPSIFMGPRVVEV